MSENQILDYNIIAVSSYEHGSDFQLLQAINSQNYKSWESSRFAEYPVEIIIKLEHRSEVSHALLSSKEYKPIPHVKFQIGDGYAGSFLDVEYRESGEAQNILQKTQQVKLLGIGTYLKLLFLTGSQKTPQNQFGQVSLKNLQLWGRITNYTSKIRNEDIQLANIEKQEVDKILIGLGMPLDLLSWFEEDDRNYQHAPIDEHSRDTLQDLEFIKNDALKKNDFSYLKQISHDIRTIFENGKKIWQLLRDLEFCIAKEDFDQAIQIKDKLKKLESIRNKFDAIYETQRYEQMIIFNKPETLEMLQLQQQWDEKYKLNFNLDCPATHFLPQAGTDKISSAGNRNLTDFH